MLSSNTSAVSGDTVYVENVFSTYLYTGNGSTQTINNGIDLAGKGGMVWIKDRGATWQHTVTDSARGVGQYLGTNLTNAQQPWNSDAPTFTSTGLTIPVNGGVPYTNYLTDTYASWTFRKQPKFFDVVTYTGTGSNATIAHNLGSTPGFIVVKRTNGGGGNWMVYHRGLPSSSYYLILNRTDAQDVSSFSWNPTSTTFDVNYELGLTANGGTYVAYLFAHDAGGFGLTGTDNVISCGSFTADGSGNATVNLGYEPQWITQKLSSGTVNWATYDTMRGWSQTQIKQLYPNLADAEGGGAATLFYPTATGFQWVGGALAAGGTYIYIAIRRGPMKVPTDGTKVFSPVANSDTTGTKQTTGFVVDLQALAFRASTGAKNWMDRLRGVSTTATNGGVNLQSTNTGAEFAATYTRAWDNTGYQTAGAYADTSIVGWNFGRAPSFFDEVCYTGTGSARSITHNLGVPPELIITKMRSGGANWMVFSTSALLYGYPDNGFYLNSTNAMDGYNFVASAPTATTYSVGTGAEYNSNTSTYVSYLFATCAGVSKIGSYTGTGTTKQVDCGFAAGARFVLIKRTDSTGDWYVWDTARGIVSGNDPYLLLNSTAAEVTSTDYIDAYSAGFELSSTAPAALNASGGTYIFLAIA